MIYVGIDIKKYYHNRKEGRKMLPKIRGLEQVAGAEPASPVWKTGVLTIEHQYCILKIILVQLLYGSYFILIAEILCTRSTVLFFRTSCLR